MENPLSQRIGLIGAGRMATALVQGLLRAKLAAPEDISVADPLPESQCRFAETTGIRPTDDNRAVADSVDVLILAVKPQTMPNVMAELHGRLDNKTLVISIAAGVRLDALAKGLAGDPRLVRVMPNTPCLIGHGACGFSMGPGATDDDRVLVERLLRAMGFAVEVEESLLDAVTALSGSGPAFVYLMIEALADGAAKMGLSPDVATRLAAQTFCGAAEMVLVTGESPDALRNQVTSPGGTTIAGLDVLESNDLRNTLAAAIEAATRRSVELSKLVS